MKCIHRTVLVGLPLVLLAACGAPNQDGGNPSTLSGLAVDGYVAGATVYLDITGDGVLDPFEPRARTDADGYFGVAQDGTNYCTSSNTTHEKYCLRTGAYSGELIRIKGGIDTLTGEPFRGVLTRAADAASSQITSPLTSLLGYMTAAQVTAFLNAENTAAGTSLTEADLNADLLDISTTTDAAQNHLIRTAWLVHKSVHVMATELKRRYTDANTSNAALANDFSPYVYEAMVTAWEAASNPDMETFLGTTANVDATLGTPGGSGAAGLIESNGGVNDGGAIAADMATRIGHLLSLIGDASHFSLGSTATHTVAEIEARGRAIEVLTIMLTQTALSANEAAAIADLITGATLTNLQNASADVAQIAADYIATGSATTDYSSRSDLSTALSGAGINASTPTTLNDGSGGTADVTIDTSNGTVNIDMSSVDIDGDGNPDTVSLPGTITAVNDYTSVMTLDVLGSEQTIILETDASGNLVVDTSTMDLEGVDLGTFTL
ncbi:MAG: hypothetical protein HUJ29_08745 [Gammaproteobacteria bacterium]|nr:hypothetical protein [Gammaproteobacteria bacterium]